MLGVVVPTFLWFPGATPASRDEERLEHLRVLGMFILEKREIRRDLLALHKSLADGAAVAVRLCFQGMGTGGKGTASSWHQQEFLRGNEDRARAQLPRAVLESPSPKGWLDLAISESFSSLSDSKIP